MTGSSQKPLNVGRYALGDRIAAGGMATVHLGRLVGSAGFARTVAIKRLHPHLCADPTFTTSFADEARMVARIRHPNVVPTLDVVSTDGELLIVMEYVDGEALSSLVRRSAGATIPHPVVVAIVSEMLHGLHCAHEAKSESGKPLEIVHRDVSPQNVLVGADGVARLVDFGIARTTAKSRENATGENDLKGKIAYMAPEQIRRENVTRRTDIFAAGIVLWELLTGKRLFASDNEAAVMEKILVGWVQPPSAVTPGVPSALDDICLRALDSDPNNRYATAREMAVALEDALGRALGREVGAWVEKTAADVLEQRRALIAAAEKAATTETRNDVAIVTLDQKVDQNETVAAHRNAKLKAEPASDDPELQIKTQLRPTFTRNNGELFELEATGTAFAETTAPTAPANPRSRMDRYLYGALGAAVLLVILVGAAWSRIRPAPAMAFTEELPPATTIVTPPPAPSPAVTTADPDPTPSASAAVTPPPSGLHITSTPPVTKKPGLHIGHPPPAKAKAACVAKLDPATGKKIYQGDCD